MKFNYKDTEVALLKLERVQVICPACGQQVEAVAKDGQVKGYCAVAKQYVDFLIERQRVHTDKDNIAEVRAKISAAFGGKEDMRGGVQRVPNGKMGVKVSFSHLDIISTAVYNFEKPVDTSGGAMKHWS